MFRLCWLSEYVIVFVIHIGHKHGWLSEDLQVLVVIQDKDCDS